MYYCMHCACRVLNVTPSKMEVLKIQRSLIQIDVTLRLSTGEKLSQHTFSVGEASLCVKNLIEAFGESKDNRLEQDVDVITETTINKRMKDVEHYHVGGGESSKKMKNIKIEKD